MKINLKSQNLSVECERESDFYGNSFILNYLFNKSLPRPILGVTFKHGWFPNRHVTFAKQIVHWGDKNDTHICFNSFQKSFLENAGYSKVQPMGAPFLYAYHLMKNVNIHRERKSLLIMPTHTLSHIGDNTFVKDFFDNCIKEADELGITNVSVCIHQESSSPEIIDYFNNKKISIIRGAKYNDPFSLINQTKMFRRFDHVITNGQGSHIAYALYAGCKTKIINFRSPSLDEVLKHQWFLDHKEIAEANVHEARNFMHSYPEFFEAWVNPDQVEELIKNELGYFDFQEVLKNKELHSQLFMNDDLRILKWNLKNKLYFETFRKSLIEQLVPSIKSFV